MPLGSSPKRRSWLWGVAAVVVAVIALAMWHTGGDSAAWLARFKASANGTGQSAGGDTSTSSAVVGSEESSANAGSVAPADTTAASGRSREQRDYAASWRSANAEPAGYERAAGVVIDHFGSSGCRRQGRERSRSGLVDQCSEGRSGYAGIRRGCGWHGFKYTRTEGGAADSWFSVRQKDGKEVFSGLVKADSVQRVAGEAPFKITIGNRAGLDSLTFDGQPVEAAKFGPAKGNVARFSLP